MSLLKKAAAAHEVVYTVNPELYLSTLVMENGLEIVITDDMVERACGTLEHTFYPWHVPSVVMEPESADELDS
jgi:hypothetical protein